MAVATGCVACKGPNPVKRKSSRAQDVETASREAVLPSLAVCEKDQEVSRAVPMAPCYTGSVMRLRRLRDMTTKPHMADPG